MLGLRSPNPTCRLTRQQHDKTGLAPQQAHNTRVHAEFIEGHVRREAQQRHWFKRQQDGSGIRLDNQNETMAKAFPTLPIRSFWQQTPITEAMQDYITWLSPLLLALPLTDQQRAELEILACRQRPTLVANLYRVYPTIIQSTLIKQACVETKLRHSQ
jgi:hypothetical protein